jgi:hypothetical protein
VVSTILTDEDYQRAADALDVDVATVRAVAEVEAGGRAFLPDGRPQILYEAHIFHRESKGAHGAAKDSTGKALSAPSWDRSLYGASGAHQHNRLAAAAKLDWDAAHKACSWGMFQILGQNHKVCGYDTVAQFVDAMNDGAGAQLDAFVSFVKGNRLNGALRRRDWAAFARGYNGPGYAQNAYDTKLAAAYRKYARL